MPNELTEPLLPGPCCACEQDVVLLRNIIMLPFRRPNGQGVYGGWGCAVCRLPGDGATTYVCDPCLDSDAPILFYVAGEPKQCLRRPVLELTEHFDHDEAKHEAEGQHHF